MKKEKIRTVTFWVFRKLFRVLMGVILFLFLYLAVGFVLSRISTSKELAKDQSVTIFVHTNGVHTDVVLPYLHAIKNWSHTFPSKLTRGKAETEKFKWVAVGWGDKGFYLETPTWGDLTAKTAFKAAFGLSSAAIHATLYEDMKEGETTKAICISQKQYRLLVQYVDNCVLKSQQDKSIHIPSSAVYCDNDAFYESQGTYSLFHTCNTWANGALKACKQKACLWTWNSSSIIRLYEK